MLTQKQLEKYKLDSKSLESVFTADKKPKKIQKLIELIADRNRNGIDQAIGGYRPWAAVDLAYDAPFHQETPTLIRHIVATCGKDAAKIYEAANAWGISPSTLFCDSGKTDSKGNPILELNIPAFAEDIHVPVVRSYTTVRTAKIFNDRNLTPLFKYEPVALTSQNRIRCELTTDWVQARSTQMDYASTIRQMILQESLYSLCLAFPKEPWFKEEYEDENGKVQIRVQGIRYDTPHITKLYWDLQHPVSTLNTDTGCEFAGYFAVARFGNIASDEVYWNTDKISYGTNWFDKAPGYRNYFEQAFPCTLEFPSVSLAKETDREKLAADRYTTKAEHDKAVFLGYQFCKLVPKDWGLGTYKYPVWIRFIIAGHDTIIHAEGWNYRPITYMGYDADQGRGKNVSLALEIIPSQDLLGNLLTQIFLTVKRNLSFFLLYDSNMEIEDQIKAMQRRTNWAYQTTQMAAYDSIKLQRAQIDPANTFVKLSPPIQDVSQMMATINIVISMLERLLVMSPQEIGSAASHQQSKAEVVITAGSTTNRVTYTASFVDQGIAAIMRQQYEAMQVFGGDEVKGEVSADIPDLDRHLKELGFEITARTSDGKKVSVKGKKKNLKLESFAANRAGPERGSDNAVAQAMFQAIMAVAQNQSLSQIADPSSMMELLEQAAKFAGADDDFKVRVNKDALQSHQLQQSIQQIQQMLMKQVEQTVAKPAAEAVAEQEQKIEQMLQTVNRLESIISVATQAPPLQPPQLLDANNSRPITEPNPEILNGMAG